MRQLLFLCIPYYDTVDSTVDGLKGEIIWQAITWQLI